MTPQSDAGSTTALDESANLETVLAAWHQATVRLEKTHETLRGEVRRLTAELEEKNRQLARKNRLADLGQIASHVAHEVRNNLVPLTLYTSLLRRRLSDDEGSLDVVEKIEAGLKGLDATVNGLLNFTSDRDPRRAPLDVHRLVQDVLDSLAPQLSAQEIGMQVDVPGGLLVTADGDMLRCAVSNLVLNAIDALPDGGPITVTSYRANGVFEIEVADSGPGLSEESAKRAFEPFLTTKRSGTGLGLAIVERIAEAHEGRVSAANCPEGGAAITLHLPAPRILEAAA